MRKLTLAVGRSRLLRDVWRVSVRRRRSHRTADGQGRQPACPRSSGSIDGANISIEYGRPALKGRTPGKDIDPYEGKEWRTGADEQTTLVTDKPLKFGTLAVPAGTYGLHSDSSQGDMAADRQQA